MFLFLLLKLDTWPRGRSQPYVWAVVVRRLRCKLVKLLSRRLGAIRIIGLRGCAARTWRRMRDYIKTMRARVLVGYENRVKFDANFRPRLTAVRSLNSLLAKLTDWTKIGTFIAYCSTTLALVTLNRECQTKLKV